MRSRSARFPPPSRVPRPAQLGASEMLPGHRQSRPGRASRSSVEGLWKDRQEGGKSSVRDQLVGTSNVWCEVPILVVGGDCTATQGMHGLDRKTTRLNTGH